MTLSTDQHPQEFELSETASRFVALRDEVIDEWERMARESIQEASAVPSPVLTDTLPAFYDNIGQALSPGHPRQDATSDNNAAAAHGGERARMTPFKAEHIAREYQLLREAIARVAAARLDLDTSDWAIIDRSLNAATIEALRAHGEVAEGMRAQTAATLSHDMRTPLSVVANAAQLIHLASDAPAIKNASSKISSNAKRLESMLGELVDALTRRRAASLDLRLTRFDMLALAKDARDQYALGGDGVLRIEVVGESIVGCWCRDSMRRALENLINNALKYGDGRKVWIKACESRGRLMLSVQNFGSVIPKDRQERIFEYLRRDDASESIRGWGIGLPFVKSVAEAHGGTVAVDSSQSTGTTVLIDIPVDARPYVLRSAQGAHEPPKFGT